MSDHAQPESKTSRKIFTTIALVIVLAIFFGGILIAAIAGGAGSMSASGTGGDTGPKTCTPGDDPKTGISIPEEYVESINQAAGESGFSANVIAAQIYHESGWDPNAQSGAGAQGLAQFMPGTWKEFGNGGDPFNPTDAIAAQGRYMAYLNKFMKGNETDEEHLLRLALAGYNAGQGAVQSYGFNLEKMFSDPKKPGYKTETKKYVENIVAAANGSYTSSCEHSGQVPEGSVVETSMALAWEEKVALPFSSAYAYGRAESRPEYVDASTKLNSDLHTAYFTDCGVFVSTVMRTSGADKGFPARGTSVMMSYLQSSDKYEFFLPQSEGELQPGDILITHGHIFLYTGERNTSATGRAQGASLYTRPPSGHDFYLSDTSGRTYHAARLKG